MRIIAHFIIEWMMHMLSTMPPCDSITFIRKDIVFVILYRSLPTHLYAVAAFHVIKLDVPMALQ